MKNSDYLQSYCLYHLAEWIRNTEGPPHTHTHNTVFTTRWEKQAHCCCVLYLPSIHTYFSNFHKMVWMQVSPFVHRLQFGMSNIKKRNGILTRSPLGYGRITTRCKGEAPWLQGRIVLSEKEKSVLFCFLNFWLSCHQITIYFRLYTCTILRIC